MELRNQPAWLQALLQSHSHQDSMVVAQRQKYRSIEQNRRLRDKSIYLWATLFSTKETRIYNGKKITSLTSGVGKIGQPLRCFWIVCLFIYFGYKPSLDMTIAKYLLHFIHHFSFYWWFPMARLSSLIYTLLFTFPFTSFPLGITPKFPCQDWCTGTKYPFHSRS